MHLMDLPLHCCKQELRGAQVSLDTWKEAMDNAKRLAASVERKASAQRSHFKRRLKTMEVFNFFYLPVFDLFYLYLIFFIYLYLIYLTFISYHLTITITLLLQEESDQLRVNVLQAEAAVSKMKYDSKKVARGADVAQQVCVEVLANAQLLAASHTRKSDIKRRAYERHVKVLQVSLRLP